MSVLVKGMEIPRNCWECEFNKSTLDRMDFCTLTNKQYNWGLSERPSDCPLAEVPDDVQPVVRCKDCKEWHRNYLAIEGGRHGCELFQDFTNPDDFCSFGTKMDGEI